MDVFQALADPTRRELLTDLARGRARVVDLAAAHDVSRPAISRHLRVLAEAGLVQATDVGRERHYAIATAPLAVVTGFIASLSPRHPIVNDQHWDALDTEVRRTVRDRRVTQQRGGRSRSA